MKRKFIIFLTVIIFILLPLSAADSASTPTPTKEEKADEESLSEKINQLKDRIASRVTQLNLVEKKGVLGIVEESSETKIKITDISGNTQFIDVDEITKFSSDKSKDYGISDIKKGTTLSIIGLYNKDSKRILARFVNEEDLPIFIKGTITEIDKKAFTLTVKDDQGKEHVIDYESSTSLQQISEEGEFSKLTFSKLELTDIVSLVAFPDKDDEDLLSASRILVLTPLLKVEEEPTPAATKSAEKTPTPTKSKPTPAE